MPISSQSTALISKPSPLRTTSASLLACGRKVVAGGGEGWRLFHYAWAAWAVFSTHWLRAAGFAWIVDCVRKYMYDAAPHRALAQKTSCGPWGWAWLQLDLPAPKHSLLGYSKISSGQKKLLIRKRQQEKNNGRAIWRTSCLREHYCCKQWPCQVLNHCPQSNNNKSIFWFCRALLLHFWSLGWKWGRDRHCPLSILFFSSFFKFFFLFAMIKRVWLTRIPFRENKVPL